MGVKTFKVSEPDVVVAVEGGLPDVVSSKPISPRPSMVAATMEAISQAVVASTNKCRFSQVKFQYLAMCCANIIILGQGCAIGWMSPSLPILLSERSPLADGPITLTESSWIVSTSSIGAAVGTIFFGLICSRIGSKNSTMLCALPLSIFWISVMNADHAWQICVGRFMSGLTGGCFISIQLFVADISNEKIRGRLGSFLSLYLNIGILIGYVGGTYLSYTIVPYIMITFPIMFFCGFMCMPNTPQYLLYKGRVEEAENSLRFYSNCKPGSTDEMKFTKDFERLKMMAAEQDCADPVKISDFLNRKAVRALLIGPTLMAINQFSGTFVLVNYTVIIFKQSGSDFDPNVSAIVFGSLQIFGTYLTSMFIDRVGRKVLLVISASGVALGLSVMVTYMQLAQMGYDVSHLRLVPVISLSFVIVVSSIGLIPVPYIIIAEVLPRKILNIGATFCTTTVSVYAFIMLKSFPYMLERFELAGCMVMFLSVSLVGIVFIIFVVPETKGKCLNVPDQETAQTKAPIEKIIIS